MIKIAVKVLKYQSYITEQKMKFSIKDFFSKCNQIRRKLWIWLHLLKKSLTLIRLGFLKVAFPGGGQFDPPFIFQEELI